MIEGSSTVIGQAPDCVNNPVEVVFMFHHASTTPKRKHGGFIEIQMQTGPFRLPLRRWLQTLKFGMAARDSGESR